MVSKDVCDAVRCGFESHQKLLVSGNVTAPHLAHEPGLNQGYKRGYQQGTKWNGVGIMGNGQHLRNTEPCVQYLEASNKAWFSILRLLTRVIASREN